MRLNIKRFLLAAIAAFVFIYVFDGAFHGVYMMESYKATASVWRAPESMREFAPWILGGQALVAAIFALIFAYGCEGKGLGEGLRFGLYITLFVIGGMVMWYAVLPIPVDLLFKWSLGALIKFSLAGAIVSLVYAKA